MVLANAAALATFLAQVAAREVLVSVAAATREEPRLARVGEALLVGVLRLHKVLLAEQTRLRLFLLDFVEAAHLFQ